MEKNIRRILELTILSLLLISSTTLTLDRFVDNSLLPKWYAFIGFSILLLTLSLFKKEKIVKIDAILAILLILILQIIFRTAINSKSTIEITIALSFLSIFIFFRETLLPERTINLILIFTGLTQSVIALLQFLGLLPIRETFTAVGSYGNPAGLGTNLAAIFPLIVTVGKRNILFKLSVGLIVIFVAVISESRAAIVSITVVTSIYLYFSLSDNQIKYKKFLVITSLALIALCFTYLYFLKHDSAVGRIFIWQITNNLIADNFFFGGGNYIFPKSYMQYQADFFSQNPKSEYIQLADNILHPFNEYLLVFVKYGAFVLITVFFGAAVLLKKCKLSSPYMLCLISLAIFSLFSYPLQYPISWIIISYSLAKVYKERKISLALPYRHIYLSSILVCTLVFFIKDVKFEFEWNKLAKSSLVGNTQKMLPDYGNLFTHWNGNHLFLYNYAAELYQAKNYRKSIEVAKFTENYWNDYDLQLLQANCYYFLGKWDNAFSHYLLAFNMCPNRFIPLYRLHQICLKQNKIHEALYFATKITRKEVKISSSVVTKIKYEMRKFVASARKDNLNQ